MTVKHKATGYARTGRQFTKLNNTTDASVPKITSRKY
jgi:hypothetical protein